jgi:hypothetical protein
MVFDLRKNLRRKYGVTTHIRVQPRPVTISGKCVRDGRPEINEKDFVISPMQPLVGGHS